MTGLSLALVAFGAPDGTGGEFAIVTGYASSIFSSEELSYAGPAIIGGFRVRPARNVNTEWYYDYTVTNVGNLLQRVDGHGGFAVMPYLPSLVGRLIQPYPMAGFCLDYSKFIKANESRDEPGEPNFLERYSLASQLGVGAHLNVSERADVSVAGFYMFHMGNDIHVHVDGKNVDFSKTGGQPIEGHLFLTLTVACKLFDLW